MTHRMIKALGKGLAEVILCSMTGLAACVIVGFSWRMFFAGFLLWWVVRKAISGLDPDKE